MEMLYVVVGVVILVGIWVMLTYNKLVSFRYRVREAWSDIDVQLKRRYDLIPNLVETVKGYMTHEREVLENVTKARSQAMQAQEGSREDQAQAENMLTDTLKTLFAVAENYPDLKANANFLDLQREITDTENKIQASRRFYNSVVKDMNTLVDTFPSKLVADAFHFGEEPFFEIEVEEERENVKVDFDKEEESE